MRARASRALAAATLLLALGAAPLRAQVGAPALVPAAEPAFLSDADFGWTLAAADGSAHRLAEFRGRVLFINMWASWCAPCLEELPGIEALRDSVPEVEFLAVSPERPGDAREWLESNRIRLPVYFDAGGRPPVLGITLVPTTFVVDRAGAIVLAWRGATDWDRPEARAMLRALLGPALPTAGAPPPPAGDPPR